MTLTKNEGKERDRTLREEIGAGEGKKQVNRACIQYVRKKTGES